jgi:hypothetical protein
MAADKRVKQSSQNEVIRAHPLNPRPSAAVPFDFWLFAVP